MDELRALKDVLAPSEILFVADAMTGQDAVRSAGEFHRALGLTGVILTKMDGDARGGAALSIRHVTGVPIKFVGTRRAPDASSSRSTPTAWSARILGMGDVLGLIEKAEEAFDVGEAKALEKKIRKNAASRSRTSATSSRRSGRWARCPGDRVDAPRDGAGPGGGPGRRGDRARHGDHRLHDARASGAGPQILERQPQAADRARARARSVQEINRLLKQFAQMKRMMKTMRDGQGVRARAGTGCGARLPFWGR